MPALRLKRASAGPTDAGVPNTNASRLEVLVNGGVTDINVAANFPSEVVAAASSLPDRRGRIGVVAAGGHHVRVVHDGEKYVGRTITLFRQQEDHELTSTLSTPTAAPAAKFPRLIIPGYKALYDAGLRAQAKVSAILLSAGFGTPTDLELHAVFFDVDDADTALGDEIGAAAVANFGEVGQPNVSGQCVGGWKALTAAPSRAHAIVVPSLVGVDADTFQSGQAVMRWIYEP